MPNVVATHEVNATVIVFYSVAFYEPQYRIQG